MTVLVLRKWQRLQRPVCFIFLLGVLFIGQHTLILNRPLYDADPEEWMSGIEVLRKENYAKSLATKTLSFPSVIYTFEKGLGNEMFMYACAYSLARKHNIPLYIKTDLFKGNYPFDSDLRPARNRSFMPDERPFSLDLFNIPLFEGNIVDSAWHIQDSQLQNVRDVDILSQNYKLSESSALRPSEYCQSELYFSSYKNEILRLFVPKMNNILAADSQRISKWENIMDSSPESVAVHFRRGDVYSEQYIPVTFQLNAMIELEGLLKQRPGSGAPTFFMFSDNYAAIKEELAAVGFKWEEGRHFLVTNKDSKMLEDFYLMSRCQHNIVAPSTFSWWTAYLNPNPHKIVIAAIDNKYNVAQHPDGEHLWRRRYLYYPLSWIAREPNFQLSQVKSSLPYNNHEWMTFGGD